MDAEPSLENIMDAEPTRIMDAEPTRKRRVIVSIMITIAIILMLVLIGVAGVGVTLFSIVNRMRSA